MKYLNSVLLPVLVACLFGFSGCNIFGSDSDSSGTKPLGGEISSIGAVGNTFNVPAFSGTNDRVFEVVERQGDVSTIKGTMTITDPGLLSLAEQIPFLEVNGNQVTGSRKYRITSKGIQSVFDDGKALTLVDYSAKKGDKYRLKRSGSDLVREVTHVSKDDDFFWGFMYIKTIQVEETGMFTPGLSKIKYYANHRFGPVALDIHFEDGSTVLLSVYSNN
jgi:hypothetical protein